MTTNILEALQGMQQAAPMMQSMAGGLVQLLAQQTQLLAAIAKNTSPASGYDVKTGTTTNKAEDSRITFSVASRSIDILIEGNDAIIQFSYDGVAFEKDVIVKAGVIVSVPFSCRGVQARSRTPGSPATYQFTVFA